MALNAQQIEQIAAQQIQRIVADPAINQRCYAILSELIRQGYQIDLRGAQSPAEAYMLLLDQVDPGRLTAELNEQVELHDRQHGPVPAARGGIDWGAEFPDSKVLKAWQELPAHSRLRETAKSPQFEALARRSFAKAGVVPFRGMTEGETFAALLSYAGKTKALSGGDRGAYDSLARHLGGVLGDGETIRTQVRAVNQIHYDDRMLHRLAEKNQVAAAEAAKYRAKPAPQPVYDKKAKHGIPQHAPVQTKKTPDTTHDEVKRQYYRQRAGGELPERARPEPLRMTINNKLEFDLACALAKSRGQSYEHVVSRFSPQFHKQAVAQLRERGLEPALANSTSSSNSSARHWVPAPPSSVSERTYPSGGTSSGGYSDSTSSGDTGSEGAAQTGSGT